MKETKELKDFPKWTWKTIYYLTHFFLVLAYTALFFPALMRCVRACFVEVRDEYLHEKKCFIEWYINETNQNKF